MTKEEWDKICSYITDKMRSHVKSFVTPLSVVTKDNVLLRGTGSFIKAGTMPSIITCEHVVRDHELSYKFFDNEKIYNYTGEWRQVREPVDVAISTSKLCPSPLSSNFIELNQIALKHDVKDPKELLFFYGFSGENSKFIFGEHVTVGTGFLTQQSSEDQGENAFFELLWPNGLHKFSETTPETEKKQVRFDNPEGLSGALVWNTRFIETGCDIEKWLASDSKVTGLLKRFDDKKSVLLATKVECIWNECKF